MGQANQHLILSMKFIVQIVEKMVVFMLFSAFRRKFVLADGFPGSGSPVLLLSLVLHGDAS